jgi:GNAT superfamily N-acetyltransferase
MFVHDYWKGGIKYFVMDLDDGEARMSLSPSKVYRINLEAYGADMHPPGKVFYVDFIKVSPQYRNCGYGTKLLQTALAWADQAKNVLILDAIPIDTGMDHHRLIRFYLSHGFKSAAKYSMYYHTRPVPRKRNKIKREQRIAQASET